MTLRNLDHYERRAVHDIRAWAAGDRGRLDGVARTLGMASGRVNKPVEWLVDRVMDDPKVGEALRAALERANESLSRYMAATTPVEPAAAAYGLDHVDDIADLHLRTIDAQLAALRRSHRNVFLAMGAAEGAAGFAGTPAAVAAFVASIPAMQAASLRAVSDVSRHTGFDPNDFAERQFVAEVALRSMELGGRGTEDTVHRLVGLGEQIATRQTLDQLQQYAIVGALRDRAQKMGIALTKRRAAAMLPVVGAAVGAGFNAVHADRLLGGASVLFRARHLSRRHGLDLSDLIGPMEPAA